MNVQSNLRQVEALEDAWLQADFYLGNATDPQQYPTNKPISQFISEALCESAKYLVIVNKSYLFFAAQQKDLNDAEKDPVVGQYLLECQDLMSLQFNLIQDLCVSSKESVCAELYYNASQEFTRLAKQMYEKSYSLMLRNAEDVVSVGILTAVFSYVDNKEGYLHS